MREGGGEPQKSLGSDTTGGTPLRSALKYAKRYGWPVFPGTVFNGQKVPLVEHRLAQCHDGSGDHHGLVAEIPCDDPHNGDRWCSCLDARRHQSPARNYRLGETDLHTSRNSTFGAKVGGTQQLFAVGTAP
jgi:hypothetical protein